MKNDFGLVIGIVLGSVALVFLLIFGLSKMGTTGGLRFPVETLENGASMVIENGEKKVSVVVFSDLQCPACAGAEPEIEKVMRLPGVKYSLRYFPLKIHKNAVASARAVQAAGNLGKGWEMVKLLFDKQVEWGNLDTANVDKKLSEYAVSLGLKPEDFAKEMASDKVKSIVQADEALATTLNLPGTPSIFVNGEQTTPLLLVNKVKELLK